MPLNSVDSDEMLQYAAFPGLHCLPIKESLVYKEFKVAKHKIFYCHASVPSEFVFNVPPRA